MMKHVLYSCFVLFTGILFGQPVKVVADSDVSAGVTDWSNDTVYHLDGYVFVPTGGTLNIEAGTVIKGLASPSTGDNASALIVARGAQIFACGEADAPIIFTAEFDDPDNANDLTKNDKGLWGGLILLGAATVGVDGGVQNVEGIPTVEDRAEYGGNNDEDNSGKLRYISIRHGGAKLEANNEINGLTLGGVGSGTEIDYVEVYANLDDGIEWFGGTVNVKHAVVSFCGDDSFDYDQSWAGKGQFWFSLQDELSNRAGEWDGSEAADLEPKVSPVISNMTLIGAGDVSQNEDNNDALRIRENAAAQVYNSIITGFARDAIRIDNDNPGADSWDRFLAGDLTFDNNVFYDFGAGNTLADVIDSDGGGDAQLLDHLSSRDNVFDDPSIAGISREADQGLDPRINGDGAAYGMGMSVGDPFFDEVSYIGAFDSENNWAELWTALSDGGYFGDLVSSVDDPVLSAVDETMQVFPNPARESLEVQFILERAQQLSVTILDMTGRVLRRETQYYPAGNQIVPVNVQHMMRGMYLVTLMTDEGVVGRRVFIKN